jgi:hypothetical protein
MPGIAVEGLKELRSAEGSRAGVPDSGPILGGGVPGGIRTHDLQLRRLSLYPAELRGRRFLIAGCRRGPEPLMRPVPIPCPRRSRGDVRGGEKKPLYRPGAGAYIAAPDALDGNDGRRGGLQEKLRCERSRDRPGRGLRPPVCGCLRDL